MESETKNPWLKIPVEDYEGHMSAPSVMQLQMLDGIFADLLIEFSPRSICVLGCTAGNGLQHLVNGDYDRVLGIDINKEYVGECRNWFVQDIKNLQLICADLNDLDLSNPQFDLVHAALVFEYVKVEELLAKIARWLKPDGIMTVVLQMPSDSSSAVSESPFQSVKLLIPFIKLVEPEMFIRKAGECGLSLINQFEIRPIEGKHFFKAFFKKEKPA